jgi:predicted RND superfamily exporter protein
MNFSVSLIGVLTLFILAFGGGMAILYAFLPLLISPLLTLGLFSPFLGRLSESTGAFSAIILGLSIDFVILLYSRYLEERKTGQGIPEALEKSLCHTGPGVFTGAVTTTAAYYALLVSDFRGIRELGFLTGTGILLSLACAFFLFPALLAWRERGKKRSVPFRPVSSFGLERLVSVALRHPRLILFSCTALTLFTILWVFQVRLNNDPRRLRPAGHSSLVLEERIREKMGEGGETLVVLSEGRGIEEALEVQGRLKVKFEEAMAAGLPIGRYENLTAFLPPLSQQQKNLEWIAAREKGAWNPSRVAKNIEEAIRKEGLRVEPFAAGLEMLREMLANQETLTWDAFQGSPLKPIGERFLKVRGGHLISASYLHVRPGFWTDPRAKSFMQGLRATAPDIKVTGSKLVLIELEKLMATEAWSISLIALAGVFLLIYFGFRSWTFTLISLLPVVLASFWTLGFMGLLGMDLNFMNVVVFTMVLGVGVDYGVHILFRRLEGGKEGLEAGLAQVGKGVVLAALTTLAGFGSLVFSGYPGLRSMGAVALMGIGFSALLSLTLLPVLMQRLLSEKSIKNPANPPLSKGGKGGFAP